MRPADILSLAVKRRFVALPRILVTEWKTLITSSLPNTVEDYARSCAQIRMNNAPGYYPGMTNELERASFF